MSKRLFLLGLLAACGIAQAQPVSTEAWIAVTDARGVQLVNIQCGSNYFDPPEIVVRSNVPVELSVRTSAPSLEFVSGFAAANAIGRQPTSHTFTPTAAGHFPLVCEQVGGAANPGQRGLLTVVPSNGNP